MIVDKGECWTSDCFRDVILTQSVFPFLNNEENVIDPDQVIFVHNKVSCMKANKTEQFFHKITTLRCFNKHGRRHGVI